MNYCKRCIYLADEEHPTPCGTWFGTCDKLGIGRNPDSDSCDKFVEMSADSEDIEGDEKNNGN